MSLFDSFELIFNPLSATVTQRRQVITLLAQKGLRWALISLVKGITDRIIEMKCFYDRWRWWMCGMLIRWGWWICGLQGTRSPLSTIITHPYIRKPLALRGLKSDQTMLKPGNCLLKSTDLLWFLVSQKHHSDAARPIHVHAKSVQKMWTGPTNAGYLVKIRDQWSLIAHNQGIIKFCGNCVL
jgi:hypothetical protein